MTETTNNPQIEALPGTVKLYQRHLIVCTGRTDWAERIENGGGFLQTLAEAVQARAEALSRRVKITACDESSATAEGFDILLFPDQIRYLGVNEAKLAALIDDHLVHNQIAERIPYQQLTGHHIFVCIHGRRDERCGLCGPPLIEQFKTVLADHGLTDRVTVRGTSHVGGHRFAGNVLIYPGGDWYGRVTPADVPRLVEQTIVKGQQVTEFWRGRMGLSPDEQIEHVETWLDD